MARALTRKTRKTGQLYRRPPSIEAAIDRAVGEDLPTISRRARVRDPASPDFLPSEALLHLLREAKRRGDQTAMAGLLPLLLERCFANLKATVPDSGSPNAKQVREDVLQEFSLMLAGDGAGEDPDPLDYYECRFNRAFRALRIDLYRLEVGAANTITAVREPDDGEPSAYDDAFTRLSDTLQSPAAAENAVFLKEVADVIEKLPPDEKEALVLRRIYGLTEEAAAELAGVTGKTIRNRLARATKKLASLKEDL